MGVLGKCDKCKDNEAVTYGPSGSYAVWCQKCADEYERKYRENNPLQKCKHCNNSYYLPPQDKPFVCISCSLKII